MAFDQDTRGKLQKFVTDIRKLLIDDFTRQLQQTYGMDPVSGEVAPLSSLKQLDDERLETAQILREVMDHYLASEAKKETQNRISVLKRIAREQAFTILNRLAALRMMEARGILLESVGQGTKSQAFQLYQPIANGSLGDTGETYKHFLFSLFDLFTADLPSLFNRYGPQSRLFPRNATLTKALDLINGSEIEPLWSEDETIGWVYQYFNSKEERKAMRDASQAPRNSRELAVRNQFFTPRYVVEFLVDNTLGRLWFNWTGGKTGLRDRCQYLLVKPNEQPEAAKRLRDPRTIKLLDPACGSMHFGLYAFDLFLEIYREAWAWEQTHGRGCLDTKTGGSTDLKPLYETYADQDAFMNDVPRLIIECNIYGVDIDPRAAQIASLALWLRAQRAWNKEGVKAKDRPQVGIGHIVAAVAPPAEVDLRKRFMEELDPLDAELFERTLFLLKDLPELGVLLPIEKELPALVRSIYGEHGGLFREEDIARWQKAEARLQEALTEFSRAARSTYQGRLFAEDALQGLRMIDHCRELFDVVVMNPPFGEPASQVKAYQKKTYPNSAQDIFQCFVERSLELTRKHGAVGVLSARTGFFMGDSETWRKEVIWQNQLRIFSDLGLGVLDDALVEAAAYVLNHGYVEGNIITASRHLETQAKESSLMRTASAIQSNHRNSEDVFEIHQATIEKIPGSVFAYWAPESFLKNFSVEKSFKAQFGPVRQGLATASDFRFVRLGWEVSPERIGRKERWQRFSKGGEYSPPYDDIHLLVDWGDDGNHLKAYVCKQYPYLNGNWSFVVKNSSLYFRPAATFTVRTASAFAAKILPEDCIFSHNAQCWFHESNESLLLSIIYFSTRAAQCFVELAVGGGDVSTSGSAARRYTTTIVERIPSTAIKAIHEKIFLDHSKTIFMQRATEFSYDETSCLFGGIAHAAEVACIRGALNTFNQRHLDRAVKALTASGEIGRAVEWALEINDEQKEYMEKEVGQHPTEYNGSACPHEAYRLYNLPIRKLIEEAIKKYGSKRWFTKKSYNVDRRIEIICHLLKVSPQNLQELLASQVLSNDSADYAKSILSVVVGIAFGRWDQDKALNGSADLEFSDPFAALPRMSPARATNNRVPSARIEPNSTNRDSSNDGLRMNGLQQGIFVDDKTSARDIVASLRSIFFEVWAGDAELVESELNELVGARNIQEYLNNPNSFFADHLGRYSKSRRKAPIYWPISTSSGSYTLWLYYPSLTDQTLFTGVNDFIEPKLKQVGQDVETLRNKGSARSSSDEKSFENLQSLEAELTELRESLLEIASDYRPNHDDGVQISSAPLWRLFRHKPWQKVLKATWDKLENGDYDWAHLALTYWPERVREKCKTDKSLAIAHDLEDLYEEPEVAPGAKRGRKKAGGSA